MGHFPDERAQNSGSNGGTKTSVRWNLTMFMPVQRYRFSVHSAQSTITTGSRSSRKPWVSESSKAVWAKGSPLISDLGGVDVSVVFWKCYGFIFGMSEGLLGSLLRALGASGAPFWELSGPLECLGAVLARRATEPIL